ncbi:hypothetical protein [Actinokineospora enzanensis]|nr:hypothetical protein [Actinokineospora enzanensis]
MRVKRSILAALLALAAVITGGVLAAPAFAGTDPGMTHDSTPDMTHD